MAENTKAEDKLQNRHSEENAEADETESDHEEGETNDTGRANDGAAQRCSSNEVDEVEEVSTTSPKLEVNEFATKTSPDDVVLRVEDKPLYVNKAVLCVFSPVFKTMFNGELAKNKDEVQLVGKKYEHVLEFLRCMYPNIMKPVTMDNVYVVLQLAHENKVAMMKNACEPCLVRYLSRKEVPEDIYETLEKACLYELNEVKEKCVEIISERPHEEFDEAESKYTFTDDVGNGVRKGILKNLAVKYKDVFGHVQTSRALYRFLGAAAKQKELLSRFLGGKVVGDYLQLEVDVRRTSTGKMCVDGIEFTTEAYRQQNFRPDLSLDANCKVTFSQKHNVPKGTYLCGVVVHNYIEGKEDIIHIERKKDFNGTCLTLELTKKISDELWNDTKRGFCHNGKIQLQIYLFKY